MNFEKVIELTKEKVGASAVIGLFNLVVVEYIEHANQIHEADWAHVEIDHNEIFDIFVDIRWGLQMQAAAMCTENEDYNNMICEELTVVLQALREAFLQNFPVQLPDCVIVLPATEMIAMGMFEEVLDENGQKCIKPRDMDKIFDLKIKIIKIPAGPAPEEFKKLWLDCQPLPAYRLPRQPGQERIVAHALPPDGQQGVWIVPKKAAIDAMREVSVEAANWFLNYFGERGKFIFRLNEAEVV